MSYEEQLIAEGKCPEIVLVHTEDGPTDGRCLQPIDDAVVAACEYHADEIRRWRSMNELEKAAWERHHDQENQ